MGDAMTNTDSARNLDAQHLQDAAQRHLWMHFTRMSTYADHDVPVIVRGRGAVGLGQPGPALPGRPVGTVRGPGRSRPAGAGRGRGRQASELAYFPLWSYAHPNAIELAERLAALAPGTSTGCSSRPAAARRSSRPGSWPASTSGRPASPVGTRCSPATSPITARPWAPCRLPGCRRSRSRSNRWCRGRSGSPTPTSTGLPSTATTWRRSADGPPTTSSGTSRWKAPSRWRPCSSSRCRTPAAASRPRLATSSGSGRSATATACCSSPTR